MTGNRNSNDKNTVGEKDPHDRNHLIVVMSSSC
jgi:hypothetical protein